MQAMKNLSTVHKRQRYLVLGLGMTGCSVVSYLLRHGYDCRVQDDRKVPPYQDKLQQQFPAVEIINSPLDDALIADFDCLVVSPGLSIRGDFMKKVAESGKRIIGDIELFAEAVDKPVLAITGSNGKSTVTCLLGEMIRADDKKVAVGGNIGIAALDLLEQAADYYVLELSSFQLETTYSLKPVVATVLNVTEDHMDRYDDLADYQQCKKSIYRYAEHCLSNRDDPLSRLAEDDVQFSLSDPSVAYHVLEQDSRAWLVVDGERWIDTTELRLKGRHNWANCLAAMAMARLVGISRSAIIETLKSFTGLPHRSQWVAEINGVSWINDSKATNPGAAKAAIDGIDQPIILIAGGQGKGANMRMLCDSLQQHVRQVLLFGQDADTMQQSWQDCVALERVDDMVEAVQRAAQIAQAGDLVLLSPACASFDMYSGYAARGDHFSELVRAML